MVERNCAPRVSGDRRFRPPTQLVRQTLTIVGRPYPADAIPLPFGCTISIYKCLIFNRECINFSIWKWGAGMTKQRHRLPGTYGSGHRIPILFRPAQARCHLLTNNGGQRAQFPAADVKELPESSFPGVSEAEGSCVPHASEPLPVHEAGKQGGSNSAADVVMAFGPIQTLMREGTPQRM